MKILLIFAFIGIISGCATIIRGTRQEMLIHSDPPGATVSIAGQTGITPCRIILRRSRREEMVSFALAEHEDYRVEIQPREVSVSAEPWLLPVVLVSGLLILPGIIDLASGCLYDWPYELRATLPLRGAGTALLDVSRKKPDDYRFYGASNP